jgi:hypothetical protein
MLCYYGKGAQNIELAIYNLTIPDDKAVIQDPYIQNMAEELSAPLNTRPK